MNMHPVRSTLRAAAMCAVAALLATGCKKRGDNIAAYTDAINAYYYMHFSCAWPEPVKFPVQVTTSDTNKTSGYDALYDQGLLVRTTAEKKVMIIASKQVTNYDLSDKGREEWTADARQPGYGNFCYGHRAVGSIDSSTPTTDQIGATTVVNYHYVIAAAPDWAAAPETQNAFPQIKADLESPESGQVTLTKVQRGWIVTKVHGESTPESSPASNVDGQIVH